MMTSTTRITILLTVLYHIAGALHVHKGNLRKRENILGRTVSGSGSLDFESLGPPGPGGTEYFLSNSKTSRDAALDACPKFSQPDGKILTLLGLDSSAETQYVVEKLTKKGTDCVWTSSNMITDPTNNAERMITLGRKGIKLIDLTGGIRQTSLENISQQRQVGTGTVTITETHFPFFEKTSSNGQTCRIIPPGCSSSRCTVTTHECTTGTDDCTVEDEVDCNVVHSGNCSATIQDTCTVNNPVCQVKIKPCVIRGRRECQVKSPVCTVTTPACITTRSPCKTECVTSQPPCTISQTRISKKNCDQVPCFTKMISKCEPTNCTRLANGTRTCAAPSVELGNCKYQEICLSPRICRSQAIIICPRPKTFCPPEVTKCPKPIVSCEKPEFECTEPEIICPPPEIVCSQVTVNCSAPIIQCPTVIATCPTPETKCERANVTCQPPDVSCVDHKTECDFEELPPEHTECPDSLKCEENCQCVKLSKSTGFKLVATNCDEQCNVLCEG